MNKYVIVALSFAAGVVAGFTVAQFISIEKEEAEDRVSADQLKDQKVQKDLVTKIHEDIDPAEVESPHEDEPDELISTGPAHRAMPGQKGINYSKVNQIIKDNGYTDPENIKEVLEDPDNEETYEERLEREELEASQEMSEYRKKNKDKIVPIQREEFESDFQEIDYDRKDLYYFTTDDVLTDEDGNHVDESEFIGVRPRQFGWMENAEDVIYIRNNPKETDYKVWKERCASTDWWA